MLNSYKWNNNYKFLVRFLKKLLVRLPWIKNPIKVPTIIIPVIKEDKKLVLFTRLFVAVDNGNYFITFIDRVW